MENEAMKIFCGTGSASLAKDIASLLCVKPLDATIRRFADGEVFVSIDESVRGSDVFVVQSTLSTGGDNLMELFITLDALKLSSPRRIVACLPYFGYSRQDRQSVPRSTITARLMARLIERAGADAVIALDLHNRQTQGFFDIPCDNLSAISLFVEDMLLNYGYEELAVVSPDVGGVLRARNISRFLPNSSLVIADKRRPKPGYSEICALIGDPKGKVCILVDDIVDSAGTLCNAACALVDAGAKKVVAYCTHGVLSGEAVDRIENSPLKEVVLTDSISLKGTCSKIRYLSVAPLFSEAIRRVHNEESLTSLLA